MPLDVNNASESPFEQFAQWFADAEGTVHDVDAVTLVTVGAEGRPSARQVLLRHRDERCVGWYTNYESRKGRELASNPYAAILWYNETLGRQVRLEGVVSKMDGALSDAYFSSRPRSHQIGAHASKQSRSLSSREALELRVAQLGEEFDGQTIPRPTNWGGYELRPDYFEFWQNREDRLHDRVVYTRNDEGGWQRTRLSP